MTQARHPLRAAVAAVALIALWCEPAFAIDFKGDGPQIWVARSARFIAAAKIKVESREALNSNMKDACAGVGGELLRIGGSAPIWAAEGHRAFCRGVDGLNGSITVKNPCGELKKAMGYYDKAAGGDYPADVIKAAASMSEVAKAMRMANENLRRCN